MDTAGKGATVKHALGLMNPMGVQYHAFKQPTLEERVHHFLWRVKRRLPPPGIVGVFDRSHYEDVVVVRVHQLVPPEVWSRRYSVINRFEEKLAASGTRVVKCFLRISKEEQRRRLIARLEDPTKHWKYNHGDVDERLLGRLPAGVLGRVHKMQHRGRAMVCRARRPQMVPQLGGHRDPRRAACGDGAGLADPARLGPRGGTRAVGSRRVTVLLPGRGGATWS